MPRGRAARARVISQSVIKQLISRSVDPSQHSRTSRPPTTGARVPPRPSVTSAVSDTSTMGSRPPLGSLSATPWDVLGRRGTSAEIAKLICVTAITTHTDVTRLVNEQVAGACPPPAAGEVGVPGMVRTPVPARHSTMPCLGRGAQRNSRRMNTEWRTRPSRSC